MGFKGGRKLPTSFVERVSTSFIAVAIFQKVGKRMKLI